MRTTALGKLLVTVFSLILFASVIVLVKPSLASDSVVDLVNVINLAAVPTVSAAAAAEKWARRAASATQDYQNGVENPSVDWAQATKASEDNYKTAVTAAAAKGSFGKGVSKAGTAAWKEGSVVKGTARWPPGISASEGKFQQGISEVLSTVASLTLPPRRVKGDPSNLQRVAMVANAPTKKP